MNLCIDFLYEQVFVRLDVCQIIGIQCIWCVHKRYFIHNSWCDCPIICLFSEHPCIGSSSVKFHDECGASSSTSVKFRVGVPREKLERVRENDADEFPSFVTKEGNPELWRPFFDEIGCDPASISLFFTLNGCTNDGPKCANNILAGLLKKLSDAHNPRSNKVGNYSALLQNTCGNIMRVLEEENAWSMTFTWTVSRRLQDAMRWAFYRCTLWLLAVRLCRFRSP